MVEPATGEPSIRSSAFLKAQLPPNQRLALAMFCSEVRTVAGSAAGSSRSSSPAGGRVVPITRPGRNSDRCNRGGDGRLPLCPRSHGPRRGCGLPVRVPRRNSHSRCARTPSRIGMSAGENRWLMPLKRSAEGRTANRRERASWSAARMLMTKPRRRAAPGGCRPGGRRRWTPAAATARPRSGWWRSSRPAGRQDPGR